MHNIEKQPDVRPWPRDDVLMFAMLQQTGRNWEIFVRIGGKYTERFSIQTRELVSQKTFANIVEVQAGWRPCELPDA